MLAEVEFQCPIVEHEIADEHLVCDLQIHLKYFRRKHLYIAFSPLFA